MGLSGQRPFPKIRLNHHTVPTPTHASLVSSSPPERWILLALIPPERMRGGALHGWAEVDTDPSGLEGGVAERHAYYERGGECIDLDLLELLYYTFADC
jgi:hypothetical protein